MLDAVKLETIRSTWDTSWKPGGAQALDQLLSPGYQPHHPLNPVLGSEGVKQLIAGFQQAFPDLVFNVEDVVAAADKFVVRWSMCGTHRFDLFGVPPGGRRVTLTGISIYRLASGQVVESWDELDLLSLLVQIGALG